MRKGVVTSSVQKASLQWTTPSKQQCLKASLHQLYRKKGRKRKKEEEKPTAIIPDYLRELAEGSSELLVVTFKSSG